MSFIQLEIWGFADKEYFISVGEKYICGVILDETKYVFKNYKNRYFRIIECYWTSLHVIYL